MSSELFEVELVGEWEQIENHPDYIIAVDKPHSIVNQVTGRMVKRHVARTVTSKSN